MSVFVHSGSKRGSSVKVFKKSLSATGDSPVEFSLEIDREDYNYVTLIAEREVNGHNVYGTLGFLSLEDGKVYVCNHFDISARFFINERLNGLYVIPVSSDSADANDSGTLLFEKNGTKLECTLNAKSSNAYTFEFTLYVS